MTVCQFYLRGQCKFGTSCRNEHPPQRPSGFGNQTWGTQGGTGAPGPTLSGPATIPFTQDGIARDLTQGQDKPIWPLSSYGPAKGEPTILEGLDESAEEMRWKALQAVQSGNIAEYQKYETDKIQAANQVHATALANIAQVYKYAHDTSVAIQKNIPIPPKPVFGAQHTTQPTAQPSAFGKPSGFGAFASQPSAFGGTGNTSGSAFGAPSNAPKSAFGNPSLGQSAFGQPSFGQSAFGNKPVSAFGQPTTATPSAFGAAVAAAPAPSAFGAAAQQPQQPQSAFGQPSQPQSAFGKPSGFGALANTGPSTTPTTGGGAFSAFAGQGTSAFGGAPVSSAPVFGQSAFGGGNNTSTTGAPATTTSAFGQPTTTSAFGATSAPAAPSAFGVSASPAPSAFGQVAKSTSAFSGAPAQSAFGQPSQPVSAFGQPAFGAPTAQPQSGFGGFGSQSNTSGFGSNASAARQLVGRPNFEAAMAASRTQPGKDRYDDLLPPNYIDLLPGPAKEAFESSKFEWGKIPEWIPPVQLR